MATSIRPGARKIGRIRAARVGASVVRREGVDGVTMRRVADGLGVTPMALYRCFDSSEDLRLASVSCALERIPDPPLEGSVRDRLGKWAQVARPRLRVTRGLADACLTDWPKMAEGCRIMEGLLRVASDHTTDPGRQVEIANALFVYVLTRAIAERAVLAHGRKRTIPAIARHPERFPHLASNQAAYSTIDPDDEFAAGLRALLDRLGV